MGIPRKNGTQDKYYFVCSTSKCGGFGMISRKDPEQKFILTKGHEISYIMHTYYNTKKIKEIYQNLKFEQKDWENEDFRKGYLKWFYENFNNANESICLEYIKNSFNEKIVINENLVDEIKASKLAFIMKNRSKDTIIPQLMNLKDENGEKIIANYDYEYTIKNNNIIKKSTLFIIINKSMLYNLTKDTITQYFGDATYHCIPPTLFKYKLYVISGFDLKSKKINICAYALLPDEKIETYTKLFEILKNSYKFNSKLFTMDFCQSSFKALKKLFPNCIIIKCFFHWIKALWTNIKKFGFTDKNNLSITKTVLFNIKLLAFIEPKLIKKYYYLIIDKYGNS